MLLRLQRHADVQHLQFADTDKRDGKAGSS